MAGEKELLNWKKVLQGLGSYAVRDENGAETFRLLRETETETDFFFLAEVERETELRFLAEQARKWNFRFQLMRNFPFMVVLHGQSSRHNM
jgi:hypothetical protein